MIKMHKISRSLSIENLRWFIAMLILTALQPISAHAGSGVPCDIQHGPCICSTNGMTITFDILPKPIRTLSELRFKVTVRRNNVPVTDAAIALDLSMPGMFMGKNRPVLKSVGQGIYEGTGIIPRCASGQRTWQAEITVGRGDPSATALYQFEVQ